MSANRGASPRRVSYDDKSQVRRQDSFSSSESTLRDGDKHSTQASSRNSWFRSRSSSEGMHRASSQQAVNLYTHCGRHTNAYLFGGHSISDSVKGVFRKKE
ncbi:hypothetical protein F4808DRAFT_82642 [Astrocystis sublimbata]|nr:hypothetical protein F4808DRAFT_82642 [Astrocystis sublimbata]